VYFIAETDIEMNARGSKFEQLISDQIKFYMVIDFITIFDIRRQLGKQFLGIQRDVGFLIPTENTLRNVGEKELDIPSRITPGFIGPMLEMAQEQYGPDSKLVLANDERKVIYLNTITIITNITLVMRFLSVYVHIIIYISRT